MVSCAYCNKVEPFPYQCNLCLKHFCSAHKLPETHECMYYTSSSPNDQDGLKTIEYELRKSHEELPYFIHAKTNVPYLVGRQGHTIIAVELKKFGWRLKLYKSKENEKDIMATKNNEKWHVRIKTTDGKLSDALRNLPINNEEVAELSTISEKQKALPVIAIVAYDSAVLLSAKTFRALSPELQ